MYQMVHQESKKSTTTDVPGECVPMKTEKELFILFAKKINEVLGETGNFIVGTLDHNNFKP